MSYAEGTRVPVNRSIDEIRSLLLKAGATHYAFAEGPESAFIQFALSGLHYRFEVRRPTQGETQKLYAHLYAPQVKWPEKQESEWRRRWRARVLWVKAQIEFSEVEPDAFRQAMLAYLVLPDGQTFGRWAAPQIEGMYQDGVMPPLLGPGGSS